MQNTKTFTLGDKKLHLLFLTTVGSRLHKLNLSNSDTDFKGVFLWDKDTLFGLDVLPDTLDVLKTDKEEWKSFMAQLNQTFNLNLEEDDDVSFFEAKKFFLTSLKNDFNMLDMLFSEETPVFCSENFKPVLDNRRLFLDTHKAVGRFGGMARSALHEAKKLLNRENKTAKEKNDLKKNLSKSLQFLFSLDNFLKTHTHNPVLKEEQRAEVLEVKKGNKTFEEVEQRHSELSKQTEYREENTTGLSNEENKPKLQKLLVELSMSVL